MVELQKRIIYRKKGFEKVFSMIILSQTSTETITIKNLKLSSNMVYVKEKSLLLVGCYIPYERSCQAFLIDNNLIPFCGFTSNSPAAPYC